MNSLPDELKSGKTELSDDMLDVVSGGSAWTWIKRNCADFAEYIKENWWF